jgi:hypothetical protein
MPFILNPSQSMNPSPAPSVVRPPAKRLWLRWLLAVLLLLPVVIAVEVASCFHLSSDTKALRNSLIKSSDVEWRQRIALNVGGLMLSAVRAGLSFVHLDAGGRAVLQSVRGAEVGVYQLPSGTKSPDRATLLAAADAAMIGRGWARVVGVMDGQDLVAVYLPGKTGSTRRMKCCLMVFDGKVMVVVSARANLEPLLQYAFAQPAIGDKVRSLVRRRFQTVF